ncbi:L-threonine synthase [Geothermobacter ehrlichii]|uniref:Threonine synthase n=1 Tax=Geothermobacter ehrlichii TaxID=213224 RepID=A0A5D3WLU0_9BACT|nr:threonine synthase [Geothermobacter ehrlichii]TYO99692.1 L-threonine synthase [Geothermobacter ehrlichii]
MDYQSTRGKVGGIPFSKAVLMGLADDGGLLLPAEIPRLTPGDIDALGKLDYRELAFQIISLYATDIPAADLRELVDRSYAAFTHPDITPVVHKDGVFILELFHGPTLAFKDVALQFLGNLFEYLLAADNARMNILGATSGDTGSAAIYGVRGKKNINIFILHPHGRVSPIQKLQMTTVTDDNVFNLAIRGTFDDGQAIVKEIFGDVDFKQRYSLGAINSINWARVLAQIVYYFHAWNRVREQTGCNSIDFAVPTGNFGDIFAGYVAKRMGLPVGKLLLATNENNILTRFINEGDYSVGEVRPTLSPSMDIQKASNFERYLYYLLDGDSAKLAAWMQTFNETGRLPRDEALAEKVRRDFASASIGNDRTLETIRDFHAGTGYILDPHTATGVATARVLAEGSRPVVCLATAHPAKFGDAVQQAIGQLPPMPQSLAGIEERESRCKIVDADTQKIRAFIEAHAL